MTSNITATSNDCGSKLIVSAGSARTSRPSRSRANEVPTVESSRPAASSPACAATWRNNPAPDPILQHPPARTRLTLDHLDHRHVAAAQNGLVDRARRAPRRPAGTPCPEVFRAVPFEDGRLRCTRIGIDQPTAAAPLDAPSILRVEPPRVACAAERARDFAGRALHLLHRGDRERHSLCPDSEVRRLPSQVGIVIRVALDYLPPTSPHFVDTGGVLNTRAEARRLVVDQPGVRGPDDAIARRRGPSDRNRRH